MTLKSYIVSTDIDNMYALTFIDPETANNNGLNSEVIIGTYSGEGPPKSLLSFNTNPKFLDSIGRFIREDILPILPLNSTDDWTYIIDQRDPESQKNIDVIAGIDKSKNKILMNPNYLPITNKGLTSFGDDIDSNFFKFLKNLNSK